jgi:hypothetical protein
VAGNVPFIGLFFSNQEHQTVISPWLSSAHFVTVIGGLPEITITTCPGLNEAFDIIPSLMGCAKMSLKNRRFHPSSLRFIANAEDFQDPREPLLRIGDWVRLNSGGPSALVVETDPDAITIAWRTHSVCAEESTFPRACLHRVCLVST